MASAAPVTEDASVEPVNSKTCVLRVSIHCEGCKKKVKKILKKIHGVEDIIIDSRMHKVTVIGNVNGEALVRKLSMKGKHAEFWRPPTQKKVIEIKEIKQETLTNDEIKKDPQPQISKDDNSREPEQQNQSKPEEKKLKNITIDGETRTGNSNKSANEGLHAEKGVNGPTPEAKAEGKLSADSSPVNPMLVTDNTGIENGVAADTDKAVGSGIIRKKKGKKGHKSSETSETVQIPRDTEGGVGSSHPASQATESVYLGPERQHPHPYPSYDTPPTYVMSYNTVNPRSSHGETYYAQPPTYTYSQPPPPPPPPPQPPYMYAQQPPSFLYSDSPPQQHPQQQSDSFIMFSDENANGCSIM